MNSFLKQSWLVLLLAAGFGVTLAAVEKSLQGRIESNREARLRQAALEVLGATADEADAARWDRVDGVTVLRVTERDGGALLGWAVKAVTDKGYAGRLEVMVGLDAAGGRITGLQILTSSETPGLGDRIRDETFRMEQFAGKSADTAAEPLTVVRGEPAGPAEVQAVTGATISSRAVVDAANGTLGRVVEAIGREGADE